MYILRSACILLIFSLISCKTKYATKEFKYSDTPEVPNYENLESWAAHPSKTDSVIDIFYTTDKKNLKVARRKGSKKTNLKKSKK